MTCQTCRRPVSRQSTTGLCRPCANAHRNRARAAAVNHDARREDVLWMLDAGERPDRMAARLGLSDEGLKGWVRRFAPDLQQRIYGGEAA